MNNFLHMYWVPTLKHDQINHLNSPLIPKEIESVVKSPIKKKSPGPDKFTRKFYHIFKEELIPILFKLFNEIETQATVHKSSPKKG